MENILSEAMKMQDELTTWRRYLHQNPEIGMNLSNTAAFVKEKLESMGYEADYIGGTGVTATAGGKKPGKCFLLRADMDALPITEEADVDFKSTNGKMHACGHDFHTTMLLGAAKLLKQMEDEIPGTVKLMFQPGEETLEGAKAMLDAGILENPKVDAAAMFHVAAGFPIPSGVIIVPQGGQMSAASDHFEIRVRGKGGHGAMPENTHDPINAAVHIHLALQTIQSREISSGSSAVITIGSLQGGTASNVIPDTAILKGTVRTFDNTVRQFVLQRIQEIAETTAKAFRTEAEVEFGLSCPSLIVDDSVSKAVFSGLKETFGPAVTDASVFGESKANGSEDFAFVTQRVPAVMMMLSAGSPEEGYPYSMHHPQVKFNEKVLSQGAAAYAVTALSWLNKE